MRRRVIGILTAALILGATGFTSGADGNAIKEQLAALTPDYPAPPLDVLAADGELSFAASLLGLSLEQDGKRLAGDVPAVSSDSPLVVKTYWRANVRMDSRMAIQFCFWDHLTAIRETVDLRVGPSRNDPPWEVGGVYVATDSVDLRAIARMFSGHGWLGVNVRSSEGKRNAMRARQLMEISLSPHTRESGVLDEDVAAAFGSGVRFINLYARLGYGAQAAFPVPDDWQTGNRRLGVVSSMSYRAPDQGEIVCRIAIQHGGQREELLLRSGVSTAICNIDMLDPESENHEKVAVFSSRDSGQFAADGTPGQLHSFYALFDLPDEVERIESIEFVCEAATVLDILGVALLP